jgi:uncharacterized coiled-coil protein SlyX
MNDNDDIVALQVKVAHLEQLCEEINGVVTEQADMISFLKAKLNMTAGKIQELEVDARERGGKASADEKPPHW